MSVSYWLTLEVTRGFHSCQQHDGEECQNGTHRDEFGQIYNLPWLFGIHLVTP